MKKGNCIIVACNNVLDNSDWLFCYAYVMGQGEISGQRILHAWNEINGFVLDFSNGKNICIKKERYYQIAEIKESDVTKQTGQEISEMMLETGTYGGWIK